jgi:hypothetical protein
MGLLMKTKRELIALLHDGGGDLDAPVELCFPGPEHGEHYDYTVKEVTVVAGTDPTWTVIVAGDFTSGGG